MNNPCCCEYNGYFKVTNIALATSKDTSSTKDLSIIVSLYHKVRLRDLLMGVALSNTHMIGWGLEGN